MSVATDGTQPNGVDYGGPAIWSLPAISANGRFVAFASHAYNLVEGDTNSRHDVFVRDQGTD